MAQVAACRWEAAHSAFLELKRKRLPPGQRRSAQVVLAALESLLGQPQQALDRLSRAQSDLSSWQGGTRVLRCQAAAIRAGALVREAAAATGAGAKQRGDYQADQHLAELAAAEGGAGPSVQGVLVGQGLGRISGGRDLEFDGLHQHLQRSTLATTSPRLAAWAKEAARTWGIEE